MQRKGRERLQLQITLCNECLLSGTTESDWEGGFSLPGTETGGFDGIGERSIVCICVPRGRWSINGSMSCGGCFLIWSQERTE